MKKQEDQEKLRNEIIDQIDTVKLSMTNAALFPLALSDAAKIGAGLTASHILGCPTTD